MQPATASPATLAHRTATLAALGAIALAGTTGYALWRWQGASSAPDPAEVALPAPTSVTALGHLQPAGEVVNLAAPPSASGSRVESLAVEEGDWVEAGQVVAVLDDRDRLEAALARAREDLGVAEAKLARVRAGAQQGDLDAQQATIARLEAERGGDLTAQQATIARLEAERDGQIAAQRAALVRLAAELDHARAERDRHESLYATGAISASLRDSKLLAFREAQARLDEARANLARLESSYQEQLVEARATLNRTRAASQERIAEARATFDRIAEVRPSDLRVAEAEVAAARAAVRQAEADRDRAIVTAPIAGRVLDVYARPGERPDAEGIADLARTDRMEVVAEVYDSDIGRVREGQRARIVADAFEGELWGTVTQVGWQVRPQATLDSDPAANIDERIVEVRVTLDEAASETVAALTHLQVTVTIEQSAAE